MLDLGFERARQMGIPPSHPRPRPTRREMYAEGGVEPKLEDLLTDPLTEAVMRRDGVSVANLRELIQSTRRVLLQKVA